MIDETPSTERETDSLAEHFVDAAERKDRWAGDYHTRVLADYAMTVDTELVKLGWAFDSAKSYVLFDKFDQSMLSHTRSYVTALVQLNRNAPSNVTADEAELRGLVGMAVVHDLHKLNDDEDEFDLSVEEVADFADKVGVREFAPCLSDEDLHSAAVGMHKRHGYKGRLTERFLNHRDLLRLADACASNTSPDGFRDEFHAKLLRNAYCDTSYDTHAHTIKDVDGSLAPLVNGAVHDVMTERGYDLLQVYESGCTYVSSGDIDANISSDGVSFIDDVYDQFRTRVRNAYSSYKNPELLTGGVETVTGHGYFKVNDIDLLTLSKEDVLSAIVQAGVVKTASPFDISEFEENEIEEIEDLSGVDLPKTPRLVGLARMVHTVYRDIAQNIVTDDVSDSEWYERSPTAATLVLFNPEPIPESEADTYEPAPTTYRTMQQTVTELWAEYDNDPSSEDLSNGHKWPYKYLIAKGLLDYYYDGATEGQISDRISETLIGQAEEFPNWETFRTDQVGHIDEELRSWLVRRISVDGASPLDDPSTLHVFEEFIDADKDDCGICGSMTTASQTTNPDLLKSEVENVSALIKGDEKALNYVFRYNRTCYACQLDISIRRQLDGWDDQEGVFHVHPRPKYAYSPISQTIFNMVVSRHERLTTTRASDFADAVFNPEDISWYEDALRKTAYSASGPDMFGRLENAFKLDTGFNSAGQRYELPNTADEVESLATAVFTASVSALYAGFQVSLTRVPELHRDSMERKESISLDHGFEEVEHLFGDRLPLDEAGGVLRSVAAVKTLSDATPRSSPSISEALNVVYDNSSITLKSDKFVGSAFLHDARTNGSCDVSSLALPAQHLNENAVDNDALLSAILSASELIGPAISKVLCEDPTADTRADDVARIVASTLSTVSNQPSDADRARLKGVVRHHLASDDATSVNSENDHQLHEVAAVIVDGLYGDVCNGQMETFTSTVPVVTRNAVTTAFGIDGPTRQKHAE